MLWRVLFIFFIALGLIPSASSSAQERLIAAYYPPMMITAEGERNGFSVDIVQEAARRLGRTTTLEFLPFKRAMKTVQFSDDAIQVSLIRNPTREPLFRWIAATHQEEMVFLTLGSPIDSLEAARSLSHIGVERGSALDVLLTNNDFDNLERVDRPEVNARKLQSGRIQAWALAKNTALATWAEFDFKQPLTAGAPLRQADIYIVASLNFRQDIAARYARMVEEMRADGTIDALIASYTSEAP